MEDTRTPFATGVKLIFSGIEYIIKSVKGKGSNAICYYAEYEDSQIKNACRSVIIKELFPLDEDNRIYRDETGNIKYESSAGEYFDFHRSSFLRGAETGIKLQALRADKVMPSINTYEANNTLYSIIGISGGITLADENYSDLKSIAECVINILYALKVFHSSGLMHLDISPDNIMLMPRDKDERSRGVILIDYNSAFSSEEIKNNDKFYISRKEPYSAPEIIRRDLCSIGFSTDLYSVAAVFAWLTEPDFNFHRVERNNFNNFKILESVPETAAHKALSIIFKGLRSSANLRYLNIDEFIGDLNELIERIDGGGVTHASIWESSLKNYKTDISANSGYSYLRESNIPSQISLDDVIKKKRIEITGAGGIGKSTALLRIWSDGIKKYDPRAPAPVYFKLGNYNGSIRRRCIDRLNSSSAVSTTADAIRFLNLILNKCTEDGTPSVIFLLDGLNEVPGEHRQKIIDEIKDLISYKGTAVALTSRVSEIKFDGFVREELKPLEPSVIKDYLNTKKIIYPDSENMNTLLSNPMMLSIYAEIMSDGNSQAEEYTQESLIRGYSDYLILKSDESEASSFAIKYVLPAIAHKMKKKHFISEADLYKIIKIIYSALNKKSFEKTFPDFRGERQKITRECKNYDEWFSYIIKEILIKKLILLNSGENKQYIFTHHIFRDYFYKAGIKYVPKLYYHKNIRNFVILYMILFAFIGIGFLYDSISSNNLYNSYVNDTRPTLEFQNNLLNEIKFVTIWNIDLSIQKGYDVLGYMYSMYVGTQPEDYEKLLEIDKEYFQKLISEFDEMFAINDKYYTLQEDTGNLLAETLKYYGFNAYLSLKKLFEFNGEFSERNEKLAKTIIAALLRYDEYALKIVQKERVLNLYQLWLGRNIDKVVYLIQGALIKIPTESKDGIFYTGFSSVLRDNGPALVRWETSFTEERYEQINKQISDIEVELSDLNILEIKE